jgi:hypothetical protein
MIAEIKCPIGYTFALHIPFHLLQCRCNTCTNFDQQMIDPLHIITWPYWFIDDLDLTCSWLLPSSIGAKSLLKLPRHAVYCFKVSDLPFTLSTSPSSQVLSQSSPPRHMTPCHVSYAMSSIITCVSFVIYPSHFELHGLCCSDKCSCGLNHLCILLKHILVHLWLSLNYQNQTRDLSPCQL